MADPKRVGVDNSGLQGVSALLDLLGGQKSSSTTTSDTSALSGILGNLQGTNYNDVLKSIFTQAGGQIPGLTAGLSNSIGARTGNNSAVSTALGKLLESTVMKAADRTAQLQQNNQQMQLQAAQGIAGGNKRTDQTSGTNTGKAAQNLAILQLGSKLLGSDTGKGILNKGKSALDSVFGTGDAAAPIIGPDFNPGVGFDTGAPAQFTDAGFNFGSASDIGGGFGSFLDAGGSAGDLLGDVGSNIVGDVGGNVAGDIPLDDISGFFGMADGGLVGRDEKKLSNDGDFPDDPLDASWEMDDNRDYPMGGVVKGPVNAPGTPQAYADGGRVEPKVGTKGPVKSGGTGGGLSSDAVKGSSSGNQAAVVLVIDPKDLDSGVNPRKTNALREDKAGTYADGGIIRSGGGRRSSAPTYDPLQPQQNQAVQSPRAALNPGRRQDELTFGPLTLDSGPGQESNTSAINSIDPAQSVAVGNAIGNAVGNATMSAVVGPIGMAAINATQSITGVTPPQSALAQAIAAISQALGLSGTDNGTASQAVGDQGPQGSSGMAEAIGAPGTSTGMGAVGESGDSTSTGTSGPGDSGAGGVGVGDSGTGYSRGGQVAGPGTGTSDSIPARLSQGEYVIPADVVQSLGVRFFDELKNHFHTPAAVQNGK